MTAALAVAWLALFAGAAPLPNGYALVPRLKLGVDMDMGIPAEALVASPWASPSEPEAAPEGSNEQGEARFIQSEVQGEALVPIAPVAATLNYSHVKRKSPALALALTLAVAVPTLFIGPSIGHLYAGDWKHFLITGGGRFADLTLLVLLEKFAPGFGTPALIALWNVEHVGKSFAAYPVGCSVDLVLLLALIGSTVYDAVDSWRAAVRFNDKLGDLGLAAPQPMSAPAAAAIPPPARP
jgi:hypothetical protein